MPAADAPPMEHTNGLDVGWMTHVTSKDRTGKSASLAISNDKAAAIITNPRRHSTSNPPRPLHQAGNNGRSPLHASLKTFKSDDSAASAKGDQDEGAFAINTPPPRRNSWLSSMALRLTGGSPQPQTDSPTQKPTTSPAPRPSGKQAVLPPGTKSEGDAPYTPAPPRLGQSGLFGVLRRLSSHNGSLNASSARGGNGLVERRTLNVDRHRERCPIAELGNARLRKVAFCVDVEIAPMPRYDNGLPRRRATKSAEERGDTGGLDGHGTEFDEIERREAPADEQARSAGNNNSNNSQVPQPGVGASSTASAKDKDNKDNKDGSRKKEKKGKKEEERKARKEQKRLQAEASGKIPMEIYRESSESSRPGTPNSGATTRTAQSPTTDPCRIYRRCCQLRESDILKKVADQLGNPANVSAETGLIKKLDLTGYFLRLDDLCTLGDWLAVVAVREVVLEGCGLTDEGLRCVLAGLLAAKKPGSGKGRLSVAARESAPEPVSGSVPGGVIERLVLKNNNIGAEGWRHVCLFIYMCRSIRCLDLSGIPFPQPPEKPRNRPHSAIAVAQLLSRCLADRLADPASLQLLSLSETMLTSEQLGVVVEGMMRCGLRKLCLANNNLNSEGLRHVARYLAEGKCEALVLSGNDLGDDIGTLAAAIDESDLEENPLWGLSLEDCRLRPSSLTVLLPALAKLRHYRFIDLSHNRDLFLSEPSAAGALRRHLPQLQSLKRIHLADVGMGYEQAIAIAEVLPDVAELAHVVLLENPALAALADAGEGEAEKQEEACALYASLLTAAKLSRSLVRVDVEVPGDGSAELVKAMAKQVVAYCLRNMERLSVAGELGGEGEDHERQEAPEGHGGLERRERKEGQTGRERRGATMTASRIAEKGLPNVMAHILDGRSEEGGEEDQEPDELYVIGGSGVVKALACCLKNKSDDLPGRAEGAKGADRAQTMAEGGGGGGELSDFESTLATSLPICLASSGTPGPPPSPVATRLPPGKAKEMSKELLLSARRIRQRLQPAVARVRQEPARDEYARRRLDFLDQTLLGIIRRFEDEFPETRVAEAAGRASSEAGESASRRASSLTPSREETAATTAEGGTVHSEHSERSEENGDARDYEQACADDGAHIANIRPLSRTNSVMSQTSRAHAEEEARALKAGHRLRAGIGLGVLMDADSASDGSPSVGHDGDDGYGGFGFFSTEHHHHHHQQHEHPHHTAAQWQDLFSRGIDEVGTNPAFAGVLEDMLEELGGQVREHMKAKGAVQTFKQDRELILRALREADPEHWRLFSESQEKARANARGGAGGLKMTDGGGGGFLKTMEGGGGDILKTMESGGGGGGGWGNVDKVNGGDAI